MIVVRGLGLSAAPGTWSRKGLSGGGEAKSKGLAVVVEPKAKGSGEAAAGEEELLLGRELKSRNGSSLEGGERWASGGGRGSVVGLALPGEGGGPRPTAGSAVALALV